MCGLKYRLRKVTSSLTEIVYKIPEGLYRCKMILPCAHAARAPTSANSSRSRQECRRPFPPAPLLFVVFAHHTDKPCFGHMSEPKQGLENRVGKADAILYESPVYLWGWLSKRSCSGAARTHFDVLSPSPPIGRQVSSRVRLCIGLTERLRRLFVKSIVRVLMQVQIIFSLVNKYKAS